MDTLEEQLREACSLGNDDLVRKLLSQGADVNHQHNLNNWTALHWACHRGHPSTAKLLLEHGAKNSLLNDQKLTPSQLTNRTEILHVLGVENPTPATTSTSATVPGRNQLPIVPNYLANPPFPYLNHQSTVSHGPPHHTTNPSQHPTIQHSNISPFHDVAQNLEEIVLKVRVANTGDPDFIEVDLAPKDQTLAGLTQLLCCELNILEKASAVARIRKLPNTIVRRDKDVQRLQSGQELEVVLAGHIPGVRTAPVGQHTGRPAGWTGSAVNGSSAGPHGSPGGSGLGGIKREQLLY